MFKKFKIIGWIAIGMFMAPRKGVELRADFVEYLKKFKPQLQKIINAIDNTLEEINNDKNDQVSVRVETKLNEIKELESQIDQISTKEVGFKLINKIKDASIYLAKDLAHSDNAKLMAKDLAKLSISIIDGASDAYKKSKTTSIKLSEKLVVEPDEQKEEDEI